MDEYTSAHAIIKALKGPKDPPEENGLSKIAIASRTWKDSELHFPNKDEMLVDWLLSTLSREKTNDR